MKLSDIIGSIMLGQSLWALLGNLSYAFSQWFMLIVLVRLTEPWVVGQYVLAVALVAPVIMFSNMRLRLLLIANSNTEYFFSDYMQLRILSSITSLLFIVVVSYFFWSTDQQFLVICAVGLLRTSEAICDLCYGKFQKQRRLVYMAQSQIIRSTISVFVFTGVIFYNGSVVYACLILAICFTIVLVIFDLRKTQLLLNNNENIFYRNLGFDNFTNSHRTKFVNQAAVKLMRSALVLGFVALIGSLFTNVTRYIIAAVLGEEELGVYAAIVYFGIAGKIVAASLAQPILPELASAYRNNNSRYFNQNYLYLIVVAIFLAASLCGFAFFFGERLLILIYGSNYIGRGEIFLLAMLSASFLYLVLFQWYIFTTIELSNSQLVLSLVTIFTLIVFGYILIPQYGLKGAIISELAALSLHIFLGFYYIWKVTSQHFSD